MATVLKRTGKKEEFDRRKLQKSMESAGVPQELATTLSRKFTPSEEMTSDEIRIITAKMLANENKSLSNSYISLRKFRALSDPNVKKGTAKINEESMVLSGGRQGQKAIVIAGVLNIEVKLDVASSLSKKEVQLNPVDLRSLDLSNGKLISIRFEPGIT
ncbi:MAG: ATP cone domain-containing protein [Thermoplasmata archaeon]|nr:ATP cone domain-containing protein [Thermoplasmata archaeon]